jgi:hypothetical protein
MVQIKGITFNIQSEFHMLRHFNNVKPDIYEMLIRDGFTQKQINEELLLVGSKFNSDFASDINSLLQRFEQYPTNETIGINGNLILECQVSETDFPNGIGTKAVIPIQEISEEERRFVYLKKNRDVDLLHYNISIFPITNTCTLILKPLKNGYLFISSFPGFPAMPIPLIEMDLALYSNCKQFWDNHVFLNMDKND